MLADSGGINQKKPAATSFNFGVDCIPRGSRDGRHNRPLFAYEPVEQRRLAHVWPPDDGHADGAIRRGAFLFVGREIMRNVIKQVVYPERVLG